MDGYAVRTDDVQQPPVTLDIIGESAAGHGCRQAVSSGQAVRIFTGAPMPEGADAVVIQENTQAGGAKVKILEGVPKGRFVRPRGFDFKEGEILINKDRQLSARDIGLAAAMGHGTLEVSKRPKVAILATGDELVLAGEIPGPDQIIASNGYALKPMIERAGGEATLLDIARDNRADLDAAIEKGKSADILVTIGGASVGDHDLVHDALSARGLKLDFWKIAMRPGKPLMFGKLANQFVLGLPGNPVSSYVCGLVFLVPLIAALLGNTKPTAGLKTAVLTRDIEANGSRQHYLRGSFVEIPGADGMAKTGVAAYASQDSARIALLHQADCLIVRKANAPALKAGEIVKILPLD